MSSTSTCRKCPSNTFTESAAPRAGATGIAISFVSKDERDYLRAIEKLVGNKLAPRPTGERPGGQGGSARRGQRQGSGGGNRAAPPERAGV